MKIRLILTLALAALFTSSVYAQTSDPIKLFLNVTAEEDCKSEVVSYLSREIRSLKDVDIVEDDPDFVLSVIVIKQKSRGGSFPGYALSYIVTENRPLGFTKYLVDTSYSTEEGREHLAKLLHIMWGTFEDHQLFVGGFNALRSICSDVITSVDSGVFEKTRKNLRQYREEKKKLKESERPVSTKRKIQ